MNNVGFVIGMFAFAAVIAVGAELTLDTPTQVAPTPVPALAVLTQSEPAPIPSHGSPPEPNSPDAATIGTGIRTVTTSGRSVADATPSAASIRDQDPLHQEPLGSAPDHPMSFGPSAPEPTPKIVSDGISRPKLGRAETEPFDDPVTSGLEPAQAVDAAPARPVPSSSSAVKPVGGIAKRPSASDSSDAFSRPPTAVASPAGTKGQFGAAARRRPAPASASAEPPAKPRVARAAKSQPRLPGEARALPLSIARSKSAGFGLAISGNTCHRDTRAYGY